MPHKPIKVTRPRSFHLTRSTLHQPIANLSGDGEAVGHIEFDKAKTKALKAKLAAQLWEEPPMPEATQTAEAAQRQWAAGRQRQFMQARRGVDRVHPSEEVANDGSLAGAVTTDAFNAAVPIIRNPLLNVARAVGEVRTGMKGQEAAQGSRLDPALTGDQLHTLDQGTDGSEFQARSRMAELRPAAMGGDPDAARAYQALARRLPTIISQQPNTSARVDANLAPARTRGLVDAAGDAVSSGVVSTIPKMMPATGIMAGYQALKNAFKSQPQDGTANAPDSLSAPTEGQPVDNLEKAVGAGAGYLGSRAYGAKLMRNAATLAPTAAPSGAWHPRAILDRATQAYRTLGAPRLPAPGGLATDAAKASPWLGRVGTAGRVLGRLGVAGQVANAGSQLINGLNQTFTEQGQNEYADGVQAQTEADLNRSTGDKIGDTAKAFGSLALGDPRHASKLLAEHMAGSDYQNAIGTDAGANDIRAKEYAGHRSALASYFPGLGASALDTLSDAAVKQSQNNYRLFKMNDKPFPVGISSFEKRLNDPNGPFAHLPANQRAIYRDLGRRLGGQAAEGLVGDPNVQQHFDPSAKLQQYSTPHVSYAPRPDPTPQAAPAPANPLPAPQAPPPPRHVAGPGIAPHGAARRPAPIAISVPPPTPPSPGAAPIGQPISPLRGTAKTSMAKMAAAALAAMPPTALAQTATPPVPASAPVVPAAKPVVPPAPAPAAPKPYSPPPNPFQLEPSLPTEQPAASAAATPAPAPAPVPAAPAASGTSRWDWNSKFNDIGLPIAPESQARFADMYNQGLTAEAGGSEAEKQVALAARAKMFDPTTPVGMGMRWGMSEHFGDKSMLDPKLPMDQFEQKMAENAAKQQVPKIQAILDQVPSQTPSDLLKNNWQLAMIPIGLMMAMSSEGAAGKIMGLLMAIGGGANASGRYATLKSPEFAKYIQAKIAGTSTPEMDQKYAVATQDFAAAVHHGLVNVGDLAKQKADELVHNAQPTALPAPQAPAAPAAQPHPAAAP